MVDVKIEGVDGVVRDEQVYDTGPPADHAGPGVVAGDVSRRDFSFLQDYSSVQCSIERTRPLWCSGHVATIPLELDQQGRPIFSMDEIRDIFGGERYVCRFLDQRGRYIGCRTLTFRGLPPMDNGIELENPTLKAQREKEQKHSGRESENLIKYLLEQQRAANETTLALMKNQMDQKSDPLNGVQGLLTMFEALERFRGGSAASGSDAAGMMAPLLELLKISGAPAPAPAPAPTFGGFMPSSPVRAVPVPGAVPAAAVPIPEKINSGVSTEKTFVKVPDEGYSDEDPTIAEELAGLDDDDLIGVVADLIGKLGDERSIKLFQRLSQLGQGGSPADPAAKSNG